MSAFVEADAVEDRWPAYAREAVDACPRGEHRSRMIALSDQAQAIMRRPRWGSDPDALKTVFRALTTIRLYRERIEGGADERVAEACVLYTRRENERGYTQDCVVVECLSPEADADGDAPEGWAWGHGERSVLRALAQLRGCLCGAKIHARQA